MIDSSPGLAERVVGLYRIALLCFVGLLGFVALPDVSLAVDIKVILLLIAGCLGWSVCWHDKTYKLLRKSGLWLLIVYTGGLLVSSLLIPTGSNFLGSPLLRLGTFSLLASVGIGLGLLTVPIKKLQIYIFIYCVAAAAASLLLQVAIGDGRLGGIFYQADVMAVLCAVGILVGVDILKLYSSLRKWVLFGQLLLAVTLILTGTRVVILLGLLFVLCKLFQIGWLTARQLLICLFASFLAVAVLVSSIQSVSPRSLNDSANYRTDLFQSAVAATASHQVFGYGPGLVSTALECRQFVAPSLQKTCQDGYYFNSTHNIYMDRILGMGWIFGMSYALLMAICLWAVFRRNSSITLPLLLIALYYLTNVTNIEIEVLTMLLICRGLQSHGE